MTKAPAGILFPGSHGIIGPGAVVRRVGLIFVERKAVVLVTKSRE